MSVYLDASVIVPHFIDEQSSEIVREWVNSLDAPAAVSALAVGEFSSALSRLTRTGEISREFAVERLTAIDEWLAESVQSIEIESVDIRLATVFVRRFE
ncbi:MAG: type II toxin-antitoxin system VapC family toxin, partial [Janthinobacterium lividum]